VKFGSHKKKPLKKYQVTTTYKLHGNKWYALSIPTSS